MRLHFTVNSRAIFDIIHPTTTFDFLQIFVINIKISEPFAHFAPEWTLKEIMKWKFKSEGKIFSVFEKLMIFC